MPLDDPGGVPRETDAIAQLFGSREALARRYVALLGSSGVERGLIGPREVPRLWDRHVLNCAVVAELIPDGASVVDVGSGAGLPGIPLALARPDLSVTLLEPLLRRTTWLDEVLADLELGGVAVRRGRAEELGRGPAGMGLRADVVTARAVAPLERLAGWCLPLVRPGGSFLALKGSTAQAEIDAAQDELSRWGASAVSLVSCGADWVAEPTSVVVVRRSAADPGLARRSRSGPQKERGRRV
jgi:16S rRNA (guanine527-N7)-methyltransferase